MRPDLEATFRDGGRILRDSNERLARDSSSSSSYSSPSVSKSDESAKQKPINSGRSSSYRKDRAISARDSRSRSLSQKRLRRSPSYRSGIDSSSRRNASEKERQAAGRFQNRRSRSLSRRRYDKPNGSYNPIKSNAAIKRDSKSPSRPYDRRVPPRRRNSRSPQKRRDNRSPLRYRGSRSPLRNRGSRSPLRNRDSRSPRRHGNSRSVPRRSSSSVPSRSPFNRSRDVRAHTMRNRASPPKQDRNQNEKTDIKPPRESLQFHKREDIDNHRLKSKEEYKKSTFSSAEYTGKIQTTRAFSPVPSIENRQVGREKAYSESSDSKRRRLSPVAYHPENRNRREHSRMPPITHTEMIDSRNYRLESRNRREPSRTPPITHTDMSDSRNYRPEGQNRRERSRTPPRTHTEMSDSRNFRRRESPNFSRHDQEIPDALPPLFSVHQGKVVSVQDFGCFVSLPGYRKQGLVHVSQMASYRVENVRDVVAVGDSVWVKVTDVQEGSTPKDCRLALSMKLVDQSTGADLDRGNEGGKGGSSRDFEGRNEGHRPLELGAVFNTICSKCGAKGHMSVDCFSKNGQKYDLLTEEETSVNPPIDKVEGKMQGLDRASLGGHIEPMGRGRGATLPSWMTAGPTSSTSEKKGKTKKGHKKKNKEEKKKHKKKDKKSKKRKRHRSSS